MASRICLLSFFLTAAGVLQGAPASGVWTSAIGGDWAVAGNWVTNPGAAFPDGVDETAAIVAFPFMGAQTIFSSADITLHSLHIETPNLLTIDFSAGSHKLIFSSIASSGTEIHITGAPHIIQGGTPGPRITLNNHWDIFLDSDGQPLISASIDGPGSLNLYASQDFLSGDKLLLQGFNSYTGGTNLFGGVVEIGGANNVTVIPAAASGFGINVYNNSSVQHFHDNHYAPGSSVNIVGGYVDLSGTNQIMNQIRIVEGGGPR